MRRSVMKSQQTIERRHDLLLNLEICTVIGGLFLTNFSVALEHQFTWITSAGMSSFAKVLILAAMVLCVPALLHRFQLRMFYLVMGTALIYCLQTMLFTKQQYIFRNTFNTFLTTILPVLICFLAVRDFESLLKWLLRLSELISVVILIFMLIYGANLFEKGYFMGFANAMILPTEVLLLHTVSTETPVSKKLIFLVLVISNMLCVCIYGSRGGLVAVLVYAVYIYIRNIKISVKVVLSATVLLILGIFLIINLDNLLLSLYTRLTDMGYNSRTLRLILSETQNDSSRSLIWARLIELIQEDPFAVRGINADALVVTPYAHNFVLELNYDLGIFIGSLVFTYIVYCIVMTVKAPLTAYSNVLTLMMFCFIPLLLWSGSIWTSMYFWIWFFLFRSDLVQKKADPKANTLPA